MGGEGGGASRKFRRAAKKIFVQTCGSFCHRQHPATSASATTISPNYACSPENPTTSISCKKMTTTAAAAAHTDTGPSSNKTLCAICLDPLNYSSGTGPGQAIFTAQCSHAFHFACISSNVRHGSVTCPICRANWTQLPRNLNARCSLHSPKPDPILQILDDSIANSRVHRRSFLRSARYDDDDPIDPDHTPANYPRLHLSLAPSNVSSPSNGGIPIPLFCSASPTTSSMDSCLRVRLSHQPATDLVLVASPNGPHLRLMKQAMALVVFSLRPMDRLAIVTYSSAAARVFPLRRMTSYGKRTALQVIDRMFYMGQADPMEGLKKGAKILEDRVHKNVLSSILHLTDTPSSACHRFDTEVGVAVHRFHVGFGFGESSGFIMHQFEEFLVRMLGGAVKDVQMRIDQGARMIRIEELRGGEERNIPVYLADCGPVRVEYSYTEGGGDGECVRRGEAVVADRGDESGDGVEIGGRMSSGESWDFHDPFMARRWAKHLHGYRL
ncbi:E3 ubiquitin-protein ligase WAV3-like [Salvia splendens]|uniref:E3 ubiquitin-protein ligase WAV3-like n=1 Tax=Salvia splendens TaxID=180675 RepID=UPI001C263E25|nr:E3 ubiquitin-protein ligase WAV3-like [Salvia splendens]